MSMEIPEATEVTTEKKFDTAEGEKFLEMLGLSDYANEPIPDRPGSWTGLKLRDFLEVCGDHEVNGARVVDMLRALEGKDRDSAEFEFGKTMFGHRIASYIQPIVGGSAES